MKNFLLSFPRLTIALTVPEELAADTQRTFFHATRPWRDAPSHQTYVLRPTSDGFSLLKNGRLSGQSGSAIEALCRIEEEIENELVRAVGDWVAFHAGAVEIDGGACLIAGDPDAGKTTTTLHMIEMGATFLCEEVAPVNPTTPLVHPYPQVLTLSRIYAEEYLALYPFRNGELMIVDAQTARYHPFEAASGPVPLKTILIPGYDPLATLRAEELLPADVFTELLGYCFPPNGDHERLFDSVIRICEEARIFRIRAASIRSMRECLKEIFGLK
ncbi:MAG: hypothetical protein JRL30_29540 [Deltaproteobacteria bacterium]|nr:hypothetical protein [Deltaproteobacteria bacterium]